MIRRTFRRVSHSAVAAYLILALGICAGFARSQQLNNESRHHLCLIAISSWNERDAMVKSLTEHSSLPPGLNLTDKSTQALRAAIVHGNQRRDRERTTLLRLQGPRPKC